MGAGSVGWVVMDGWGPAPTTTKNESLSVNRRAYCNRATFWHEILSCLPGSSVFPVSGGSNDFGCGSVSSSQPLHDSFSFPLVGQNTLD